MKSTSRKNLLTLGFIMSPVMLMAQANAPEFNFGFQDLVWTVIIAMAIVLLMLVFVLQRLVYLLKLDAMGPESVKKEKRRTLWERLLALRPMSEEKDLLLDHDYDGIKELDNPTPPWFNFLFYGTIIIGIIYLINYHVIGDGNVMENEYRAQMEYWEQKQETQLSEATASIDETNVERVTDSKALEKYEAIFKAKCATCHGQLGEGLSGPNLTDEYWLHGGGLTNIFKSIKYGYPEKSMISWDGLIKPVDIQGLASYIMSIEGSLPEGAGKDPQGTIYKEVPKSPETETDTTASTDSLSGE